MPDWKDRLREELHELDRRISKLEKFINTSDDYGQLPEEDRDLLMKQLHLMVQYSNVLSARLMRLKVIK